MVWRGGSYGGNDDTERVCDIYASNAGYLLCGPCIVLLCDVEYSRLVFFRLPIVVGIVMGVFIAADIDGVRR